MCMIVCVYVYVYMGAGVCVPVHRDTLKRKHAIILVHATKARRLGDSVLFVLFEFQLNSSELNGLSESPHLGPSLEMSTVFLLFPPPSLGMLPSFIFILDRKCGGQGGWPARS